MLNWKPVLVWIYSFFLPRKECDHKRVNPFMAFNNYCPDCGREIIVEWCFVCCSDCGSRRSGYFIYDRFYPVEKYCRQCGNKHFEIEIKNRLEIYETNFASYKLRERHKTPQSKTKVWLETDITTLTKVSTPSPQFQFAPITLPS